MIEETLKRSKRKRGVMPKELERAALVLLRFYGFEVKSICPIYKGLCLYPICGPHLSCIFCRGKLARSSA